MRLEDGDVALRPVMAGDVPALRAALEDEELQRWFPVETPVTDRSALAYVDSERNWHAVVGALGGDLLGAIGWRPVDQGIVQVFYWITREARGRGVATKALELVSAWAFERLGAPRVQLLVEPENVGSQRVAEKAGFTCEGLLRSYMDFHDTRRDAFMFSLLPGEL